MQRIIGLLCAMSLWSTMAHACDGCGPSIGSGMGLLTDYKSNFVRLGYWYTGFEAAPKVGYTLSDRFHQISLAARYSLGKKVRLVGELPFRSHWRHSALEPTAQQRTGLGDARLLGYYVLYHRALSFNNDLYWELGGGFRLPTGYYDPNLHQRNLPEQFNLGMGSMGYLLQTNAVITVQQLGIVTNLSYQLNGLTAQGYHFGDNWTAQWTVFRAIPIQTVKLVPNFGVQLEQVMPDRYANGRTVPQTGGVGCFAAVALHLKTTTWSAGITAAIPLIEYYNQGNTQAVGRLSCQFSYLF